MTEVTILSMVTRMDETEAVKTLKILRQYLPERSQIFPPISGQVVGLHVDLLVRQIESGSCSSVSAIRSSWTMLKVYESEFPEISNWLKLYEEKNDPVLQSLDKSLKIAESLFLLIVKEVLRSQYSLSP